MTISVLQTHLGLRQSYKHINDHLSPTNICRIMTVLQTHRQPSQSYKHIYDYETHAHCKPVPKSNVSFML